MWSQRNAWAIQAAGLTAVFVFLSKDVERTMHQKPMTREQTESLTAYVEARKEK